MEEIKKIWEVILPSIASKVSTISYDLYFKSLKPFVIVDNKMVVITPYSSNKKIITTDFKSAISKALLETNTIIESLEVISAEETSDYEKELKKANSIIEENAQPLSYSFNPFFTFDNFITAPSNNVAVVGAKTVAENPGVLYNPLFIYGGVGLGKTHLLHAIGNAILEEDPTKNVIYASTEQFVNDFITSLRTNKEGSNQKFRDKYRKVDVLMLDDVQFLADKISTQEELFHTFNDLHQLHKQIVLTSDKHPKELVFLEERLRSRFQYGLTCDISLPDKEARIAILQKKLLSQHRILPPAVIDYIADKITTNIRELEGALNKVVFYQKLLNIDVLTVEDAQLALKDDITASNNVVSMDSIVDATCSYFNIAKNDIIGKKKTKNISYARNIAIHLINDMLKLPLTTIGAFFGGRDHTTIMFSRNKVLTNIQTDKALQTQINDIKNIVNKC